MSRDPVLLLAVNRIPGLRCTEKPAILERLRRCDDFLRLRGADVQAFVSRRLRNTVWNAGDLLREAEKTLKSAESKGIGLLSIEDEGYPPQLREIYDPPFLLFFRGRLPDRCSPLLAVVGTRAPSGAGRKAAFRVAFETAEAGIGVVSGLARGIDGEAHRGCLAAGGYTVAVLGHGADTAHPKSNRPLAAEILAAGGLLLTEYEPGEGPLKYRFPERNRILSGLARGTVVVEAPARSGALITAGFALEQGRDLYVHADGLEGASGEGSRRLAEEGAAVVSRFEDVRKDWYPGTSAERTPRTTQSEIRRTGTIPPGLYLARLLEEELSGGLVGHQGDYFRRSEHG